MNDPILPPEDPQQPAAQPQAPPQEDRLARLESAMVQLGETVREAAQRVTTLQPPQAPQKPPDQYLNDLAADPQGTIQREARDAARAEADSRLGPALLQMIDTTSKQLLQGYQLKVDSEFGLGTFDEVFRPQLDKDLAQLRAINPQAMADANTIEALVNRLYGGDNFHRLSERRQGLEKAASRGINHLLPTGGVPRLRQVTGDELPADVEQTLREIEKNTGEDIDRKKYAKLYYSGEESGPGRHRTSVIQYLKAIGADPDTLKMYGGGGT